MARTVIHLSVVFTNSDELPARESIYNNAKVDSLSIKPVLTLTGPTRGLGRC